MEKADCGWDPVSDGWMNHTLHGDITDKILG
jgi:hypothetical protein